MKLSKRQKTELEICAAARRLYRDAVLDHNAKSVITNCTQCDQEYDLYNPYLDKTNVQNTLCALCSLFEIVEYYENVLDETAIH